MEDIDPEVQLRRRLANAMRTGQVENPDALAADRKHADRLGVSVGALRQARAQGVALPPVGLDIDTVVERAPRAAGFLSNPQNAAIAHDDTDNLSEMERVIAASQFGGQQLQQGRAPTASFLNVLRGLGGAFRSGFAPSGEVNRGLSLAAQDALRASPLGQMRDATGNLVFTDASRDSARMSFARAQAQTAAETPEISNWWARTAYGAGTSLVRTSGGLIASVLVGNPAPALLVAGQQSGGEAYGKYVERGATPGEAALGASGEAAVEVATELIPMGFLVDAFGKAGAKDFLTTYAKSALAEVPGEQIATLAQDAIDTAIANPDKTWADYAAERPEAAAQTFVATIIQSGATLGAGAAVRSGLDRYANRKDAETQAAERDSAMIERLNAVAEASKVRARSPETFEEFIGELAQDGPVDTLYVDAQTFNQTLEDAGIRVADVEAAVPAVAEQLSNALRDGGDLAIPVEQFAARISGTDFAQPLLDHLRVNPALPSRAEVMALGQEANEALQAEVEAVLTAEVTTDAFRQSAERVKQSLLEQLNTAGRFTKDVNDAYASLPAAYYTVRAAQLGITPEEMAARFPLQIRAELPTAAGVATLDQEAQVRLVHYSPTPGLTQTDPSLWGQNARATTRAERGRRDMAPPRTYFYDPAVRNSAAEAVIQSTSPFMYETRVPASKLYDFDADPLGLKPSAEALTDEQAAAFETAVRDAGFLGYRFNSVVNGGVALFEAAPVQAAGPIRTPEQAKALEERIADLNRQRSVARIEGKPDPFGDQDTRALALAEQERVLAQSARDTNSAAFKAWFGDSKVVDENGEPLVVYHGTPGPAFEAFDPARPGVTSALGSAVETQRQGFYFTADEGFAQSFADQQRSAGQGTVLPVYLSIQNPLDVRGMENAAVDAMKKIAARAQEIDPEITNPEFIWGQTGGDRFWEVLDDDQGGAAVVQAMREAGYDGLRMIEEGDGGSEVEVWVAFNPTQIKSVDNRGTFDPADPRILNQSDPARYAPLEGAAASVKVGEQRLQVGPFAPARDAAYDYMAARGLAYQPPTEYAKVDVVRAKRLADAFDQMAHAPDDPLVRAAYSAMIDETLAQFQVIKATRLEIEFIAEGQPDPYAASPRLATQDVIENNHLWVFPTDAGFGGPNASDVDISGNPLLALTDEWIGDRQLRANDVFRIVHDYFGHVKDGTGFRAEGEENAWQSHAAMFTPLARRAMTTETRGQNSWVNYGPFGEFNKTAAADETEYAPQKIGLLPEWASSEGFLGGAETGTNAGTQSAYNQSDVPANPPFYSALARAVADSKTTKAPAAQWLATLKKAPGVKAEELEWTGLEEWLGILGGDAVPPIYQSYVDAKGNVARDDVLAFLDIGGIQLEETVLGGQGINREDYLYSREFETAMKGARDPDEAIMQLENDGPAYERARRMSVFNETGELDEDWAAVVVDALWKGASEDGPAQYTTYKLPGADDTYREFLIRLPNLRGDSFTSAERHFDEFTDVIGHARFTTRTDAEGAKVLFLEEVQSTHHETGREEGYARTVDPVQVEIARDALRAAEAALVASEQNLLPTAERIINARLDFYEQKLEGAEEGTSEAARLEKQYERYQYLLNAVDPTSGAQRNREAVRAAFDTPSWGPGVGLPQPTEEERNAGGARISAELRVTEARNALRQAEDTGGVARAPWEKSWSQLVMKRMIRYAVDNGYDKVAWINGNQQNGGQTGGDGAWFYERNLVNETNAILKKLGARVEKIEFRANIPTARYAELYLADRRRELADDPQDRDLQRAVVEAEAGLQSTLALIEREKRPANTLGIQNGFVLTDKIKEQAAQGFSLFQRNRGQIAFAGDITQSPSVISLLRTADLSTFLHETGHYFLEVDAYIASQPDAPAEVVADVNRLLAWFGVEDLTTWNAMGVEEKRQFHEQFARGFEMFLLEGRSPTPELQTLFQRFRSWLLNVYKSLTSLNVELTDEVRDVMGRMVASAEAIQNAEDVRHFKPLAETRPPYMTEQAWDEYQRAFAAATAEGLDTLSTRTVRDMKWLANARSRALKRLQAQANDARRQVRAEVTAEVNAEPINRARRFITRGTDENNEPIPGAGKLDLATLRGMYGDGEDALWRRLRVGGKYGEAGNDGIHPDVVAENFGFASGDALVRELIAAENAQEKIAGLTDQRMLERYGDIADEQAMDRATDEAVANDARARVLATEYAALAEATGQPRALAAAARQYAAGIVNRIELKRLKPHQFFAASARAGRQVDAALKKDDLGAAATAKRNQLVNMQAARYTLDAKREVDQALTLYKRIIGANDEALAKSRDMALVNATRALLAQYGLTRMKNDPMGYLKRVKAYDPQLYADIEVFLKMGPAVAKPFADMTFEEFQGMHDVVRQLWALSRRTRQIEIDGKLVDLELARKELGDRLDELGYPDNAAGNTRAPTDAEKTRRLLQGARASLRRVESWARGVDGGDTGPFRRYIWNPVSAGADRYRAAQSVYLQRFLDLVKPIEADLAKNAKIAATEIGYTFNSKAELLHAILHSGNQSNLSKLLLGRRWGGKNADGSLDTSRWDAFISRMWDEGKLTKADYDFAQSVWDLLDELKPAAQEAHRQMYGRYFDEITADEIVTPFGAYRGGYVPATTDAFMVQDAALRAEQEAIEDSNSAMFPAASNGFTKSRVEDYTRELALDVRLLPMHIDKVLKFTYIGPPVRDVARLLKGRDFSAKLQAFDPVAQSDLLLPWLQRAAKQIVQTPTAGSAGKMVDTFFREMRSRTGMQLMFANLSNTAQQVTGFSNLALRVKKRNLQSAMWRYFRNPKGTAAAVTDLSTFMATRTSSQVFEARQTIEQMLLNPNKYEKLRDFSTRHAYFFQTAAQNFTDIIGWSAAYDQAVAQGQDDADAIRFADSVIRETQGSMAPEDVSRAETGPAFMRMFTQFWSYFNNQANLLGTEFQQVARGVGVRKGAGRLFYIYLMGYAVPALMADAIAVMFRGGFDDDEDDGYLDELLQWFFMGQVKFGLAAVPVVGQVTNAAIGAFTDVPYDDRVSVSPAVSIIESSARLPAEVYQTIVEGESFNRRDTRDLMNFLGIISGTPLGALGRPVSYGVGVAQGDIQPTGPADVARGLVTGAPSPESRTNN